MESRTRPAATQETILRMTRTPLNTRHTTGFFRCNGQGDGEPRPAGGKNVRLESFHTSKPDSTPGNPVNPMTVEAHPTRVDGFHHAWRLLLLEQPQTQNAYGVAAPCGHQ
jgi:hypothetical protein